MNIILEGINLKIKYNREYSYINENISVYVYNKRTNFHHNLYIVLSAYNSVYKLIIDFYKNVDQLIYIINDDICVYQGVQYNYIQSSTHAIKIMNAI